MTKKNLTPKKAKSNVLQEAKEKNMIELQTRQSDK